MFRDENKKLRTRASAAGHHDGKLGHVQNLKFSADEIVQSLYNTGFDSGRALLKKNGGNPWTMRGKKLASQAINRIIESNKQNTNGGKRRSVAYKLERILNDKRDGLDPNDSAALKKAFLEGIKEYKPRDKSRRTDDVQVKKVLEEIEEFLAFSNQSIVADVADSIVGEFEVAFVADSILVHLQPEQTSQLDKKPGASQIIADEEKAKEPPLKKRKVDIKVSANSAFHIFQPGAVVEPEKEGRLEINFKF